MFKIYYLKNGHIIACVEEDDVLKDILEVKLSQHGFLYFPVGYPVNEAEVSIPKQDVSIMFEITKYNQDVNETNYNIFVEKIKHPDIIQPASGIRLK